MSVKSSILLLLLPIVLFFYVAKLQSALQKMLVEEPDDINFHGRLNDARIKQRQERQRQNFQPSARPREHDELESVLSGNHGSPPVHVGKAKVGSASGISTLSNIRSKEEDKHSDSALREEKDSLPLKASKNPLSTQHEWLCGGCLIQRVSHQLNETGAPDTSSKMTCGSLIYQKRQLSSGNLSLRDAALAVASEFPHDCSFCRPQGCPDHERYYWSHDDAGPRVLASYSHWLASIPEKYRLPRDSLQDPVAYFQEHPEDAFSERPYLFEYNPSLIRLPAHQIPPQFASFQDPPVYLASYRVSRYTFCFAQASLVGVDIAKRFEGVPYDAMALALLRADFSVVQEGVFDVSGYLFPFQDVRLFVLQPDRRQQGRIFLSSFHQIVELWMVPPSPVENITSDWTKAEPSTVQLGDIFGTSEMKITIRSFPSCCASPVCVGKNFNLFDLPDSYDRGDTAQHQNGSTRQRSFVETNPLQPHLVESIDLDRPCEESRELNDTVLHSYVDMPRPSFFNFDELLFPEVGRFAFPYSQERGTACCVSISDPRRPGAELLVGISHTKSRRDASTAVRKLISGRLYFNRLYAFEPMPPFKIVAVSGTFCLGLPTDGDLQQNRHHLLAINDPPFSINQNSLKCVKIGFASGITEKADNSSRVIISYGINDCTGRMVEVEKSELVQMLFDAGSRRRGKDSGVVGAPIRLFHEKLIPAR